LYRLGDGFVAAFLSKAAEIIAFLPYPIDVLLKLFVENWPLKAG